MRRLLITILSFMLIVACKTNSASNGATETGGGKDQTANDSGIRFKSYNGLVMAGYQGWFNAENDGASLGWKHYQKNGTFAPGSCSIELWPDVSEYAKTYPTAFKHADGSAAHVFSSHDASTTDLHFNWMKQYGIDGVFMQRFVVSIKSAKGLANYDAILSNAMQCAEKYSRAICLMYDMSGMNAEDYQLLIDDWKHLQKDMKLTSRKDNYYLHHNGKPLVAIWGIGFDDNRKYGYDQIDKIIDFFREQGCSILVGVPTHWRTLKMDTMSDPRLHQIIEKADIVHPWLVGRYNNSSYVNFNKIIIDDIAWCKAHGKDYAPVIFPGFSWYNLKDGVAAPLDQTPRLGGEFLWNQAYGAISVGAKSLYVAMFDEIDEGTAIFKCTNTPPVGESPFLSYQGVAPDHYLWLTGRIGAMLRKEIPLSKTMPVRK